MANFMSEKQKVRFRPDSPSARSLDISTDAIGTVICRYRVLREGERIVSLGVVYLQRCDHGVRRPGPDWSGGHGGQPDYWIIAQRGNGFQRHISGALNRPFIVLFE